MITYHLGMSPLHYKCTNNSMKKQVQLLKTPTKSVQNTGNINVLMTDNIPDRRS